MSKPSADDSLRVDRGVVNSIKRVLEERAQQVALREVTPLDPTAFAGSVTGQLLGQDAELAHQHVLGSMYRTYSGLHGFSEGLTAIERGMTSADEQSADELRIIESAMQAVTSQFYDPTASLPGQSTGRPDGDGGLPEPGDEGVVDTALDYGHATHQDPVGNDPGVSAASGTGTMGGGATSGGQSGPGSDSGYDYGDDYGDDHSDQGDDHGDDYGDHGNEAQSEDARPEDARPDDSAGAPGQPGSEADAPTGESTDHSTDESTDESTGRHRFNEVPPVGGVTA